MTHDPRFVFALRLADDALILGHRLSEWIGVAPQLEEELALANIALDLIGQARMLYAHAGEIEGKGRDEDALAYLRDVPDWQNVLLVEQPNGDFARTIVRQLIYSAFMAPLWRELKASGDATIAAVAADARTHHASSWRGSAKHSRVASKTPHLPGNAADATTSLAAVVVVAT